MFGHRTGVVWIGILLLSSMFLIGQESWSPYNPQLPGRAVFVTLTSISGDIYLNGQINPDLICQGEAATYDLPGIFKAWISSPNRGSPFTKFNKSPDVGYYLVLLSGSEKYLTESMRIAGNWSTFASSSHELPIDHGADGSEVLAAPLIVWTNTRPAGTMYSVDTSAHCSNWSSNDPLMEGYTGLLTSTTASWTLNTSTPCDMFARLYCVQQDTSPLNTALFIIP